MRHEIKHRVEYIAGITPSCPIKNTGLPLTQVVILWSIVIADWFDWEE
jgi:hypothetical protein